MKIAFIGDIGLFGCNSNLSYKKIVERFGTVRNILKDCDYIVGNLETPLTEKKKTCGGKSAYIKGQCSDVEILSFLGVTHVSLANNHIFDFRKNGCADTIRVLNEANISWFGLDKKYCVLKKENEKVCLHGYCCWSTNAYGMMTEGKNYGVNILDPKIIEKDLEMDVKNNRFSIISCHWGQEHIHYPNADHINLARKLAKNNKLFIYGHHPHVIQGIETVADSLVCYSLGNFCFDDVYTSKSKMPLVKMTEDNRESLIVIITIKKNKITQKKITVIYDDGTSIESDLTQKIREQLAIWSNLPKEMTTKYIENRNMHLQSYYNQRKKSRDFKWYITRCNLESVKMIFRSIYNSGQYKKVMKDYRNVKE